MKTFLSFLLCLFLTGSLLSQDYSVPERTVEQKFERSLFQLWVAGMGGGIHYAKTHGSSPYEYGKYLGDLFAPGWGQNGDFNALINGSLMVLEECRPSSCAEILVEKNEDGSISVITDEKMWHRYFGDNSDDFVTFNEFIDFMKGLNEAIAGYLGGTVKIDQKEGKTVFIYARK